MGVTPTMIGSLEGLSHKTLVCLVYLRKVTWVHVGPGSFLDLRG